MRKANSYNSPVNNNYIQPEDQDQLGNIQISYRKQYDFPKMETLTSPRMMDNKFSFLEAHNSYKQQQNQIQFTPRSPKVRDFLRHTTYVSKV